MMKCCVKASAACWCTDRSRGSPDGMMEHLSDLVSQAIE